MKILALDTSGLSASAAIVEDKKTIAEIFTDCKKNHSQTILPMVSDIMSKTELSVKDMDYIACSSGPGSFTGLRIGASTVKGLAFGLNKMIVPVPTLDSLAYNMIKTNCLIAPLMDARREQAYTAFYIWTDNELKRITDYMCENINIILNLMKKMSNGRQALFLGDGVPVFNEVIANSGLPYFFAPPHTSTCRASSVGSMAINLVLNGNNTNAVYSNNFKLFYIRKPQAERELEC